MYSVSETFNAAAKAISRTVKSRVTLNDTVVLDGSNLMDMEYRSASESTSDIGIGSVCAASFKFQFVMPTEQIPLSESKVEPEIGFELGDGSVEYVPLGVFRISDYSSTNGYKTVSVTAYDALGECGVPYSPGITFPTTISLFLNDVLTQCGITLSSSVVLPDYEILNPYDGDCKQQIGWVAGLLGANAKLDRSGKLIFTWYSDSGYTIDRSCQKLNGFTSSAKDMFVVNSLLIGQTESQFSYGSGTGVVHSNPYVTEEIGQSVFNSIEGTSFYPCKVEWRGNPAIDVGDLLLVETTPGETVPVAVMSYTMRVSGGLSATIESFAKTDKNRTLTRKPSDIKLEQMYDNVLGAFAAATDKIIGAKGGYFKLTYDELGFPTGWTISDTPTIEDNTKLWIMNSGGLGYSEDGGKTITKVAITMDGYINGSALAIGSVQQDSVAGLSQSLTFINGQLETKISAQEADAQISSRLSVLENQVEIDLSKISTKVDDLNSDVNSKFDDYNKWFRFTSEGLLIGESENDDSELTLRVDNDRIVFLQSGAEVAYFSNRKLYVTDAQFLSSLQIGNFAFVPRANGNLSFKKVVG